MKLRITGEGRRYSFSYAVDESQWQSLKQNDDASILSTATAKGFVGTVVGPFVRDH